MLLVAGTLLHCVSNHCTCLLRCNTTKHVIAE